MEKHVCGDIRMKTYYRELAESFLPLLLSFYDLDPYSPTRGYGDRYFWGWKLKDFNNGLLQGGVYPLALFREINSLGDKNSALDIIKTIFYAVKKIQHKNGSVDEAFPYEYAFSVSATLAFDLLCAFELIEDDLDSREKEDFIAIIERLVTFISSNIETHGFISNHLAAAVAAIEMYNRKTGKRISAGNEILKSILNNQSQDGWYLEYEGSDPGYQSLCTYYLAVVYTITRDKMLLDSLRKSIDFLSYFIHPDGTIGGEYGSRNTELFYPAGFEILKNEIPMAQVISDRMYDSIKSEHTVTLKSIDTGNFIPIIENYLVAYRESVKHAETKDEAKLPCELDAVNCFFPDSKILVRGNKKYYAVVNATKGGITKIFDKEKKQIIWDDCGYIGETTRGDYISTQCYNYKRDVECKYENNCLSVKTQFYKVSRQIPTPNKFVLLRILNATFMRNIYLGNLVKKLIVKLLITGKKGYPVSLKRKIHFEEDHIIIEDDLTKKSGITFKWLEYGKKFSTIHMASSKYFQRQKMVNTIEPEKIDVNVFNRDNQTSIRTVSGF
jgi:hypothetical protein